MEGIDNTPAYERHKHVEQGVIKNVGRRPIFEVESGMRYETEVSMRLGPIAITSEHFEDMPDNAFSHGHLWPLLTPFKCRCNTVTMSDGFEPVT